MLPPSMVLVTSEVRKTGVPKVGPVNSSSSMGGNRFTPVSVRDLDPARLIANGTPPASNTGPPRSVTTGTVSEICPWLVTVANTGWFTR